MSVSNAPSSNVVSVTPVEAVSNLSGDAVVSSAIVTANFSFTFPSNFTAAPNEVGIGTFSYDSALVNPFVSFQFIPVENFSLDLLGQTFTLNNVLFADVNASFLNGVFNGISFDLDSNAFPPNFPLRAFAIVDQQYSAIDQNFIPAFNSVSYSFVSPAFGATEGDDILIGTDGPDFISGLGGNDTIQGLAGNDFLDGGAGNDSVSGGEGNDILIASTGNDTFDGGAGNDTADYTRLGGSITLLPTGTVKKSGFSDSSTDQLVRVETIIAPFFSNSLIDASTAAPGVSVDVNLTNNSLIAQNVPGFGNQTFTVQNFTNVIGTAGNDFITGNFDNNSLDGGAGNDIFIASGGSDTINGDTGNDTVDYSALSESITLLPTGTVRKGGFFGFGTDQLIKVETIIAPLNPFFGGFNQIDASSASPTVSVTVNLANNSLIASNVPGLGTLSFTVQNFTNVTGTFQNDSITGNAQNNTLFGLGGNDILNGGGGDDFLWGGTGNDRLGGGQGNDFLNGEEGNDTFVGSQGNDVLNGDSFFGGSVDTDTADYSGLDQAITLEAVGVIDKGSAGTDQISGIETIIGATGKANAIDGSTGTSNSTFFDIDLLSNRLSVNDIPVLGSVTFTVRNFVNVTGTSQDDSAVGNARNNVFQGGRGDDNLSGEGGRDTLLGESGNDTLTGGAGNDRLIGGSGTDSLRGGSGADQFQFFTPTEGIDTILDFVSGTDKIAISLAGFGSGLAKGILPNNRFVLGTRALDANDRFIYDAGRLFFDRDGSGGASQSQIATLTAAPRITAGDILVI